MNLNDIVKEIDALPLCCGEKMESIEIASAYSCDLMSDVLAFCSPGSLLLTGLTNIQIVRTAQMLDIPAVIFVRGKTPQEETVELAREAGIPLLSCRYNMFHTSGLLYMKGVKPSSSDAGEE